MEAYEKVKRILVDEVDLCEDDITPAASLIDDLGCDSLDMVDLVMAVEDEFEIIIPDNESLKFITVGDVVNYVQMQI